MVATKKKKAVAKGHIDVAIEGEAWNRLKRSAAANRRTLRQEASYILANVLMTPDYA